MFKKALLTTAAAVMAVGISASGAMAGFPEKDITLIVPWSPGGGTDTFSRILVKNAKKYMGVNINVKNKPGGMGSIGMGSVAKAAPTATPSAPSPST